MSKSEDPFLRQNSAIRKNTVHLAKTASIRTVEKMLPAASIVVVAFMLASFLKPEVPAFLNPDVPEVQISNDLITAKLLLPDPVTGYYRGVRFDWSGVISDLTYKGHHYFGKWFDRYEPTLHDAIMGPVDAFSPIGYDSARAGETFVKIGVGSVEKIADEPYAFVKPYRLVNGGKWKTQKKGKNAMEYEHVLNDAKCSYRYTKTLSLTKGKPELVINYRLRNTGTSPIETTVFNHNFFVMDDKPTGPGFSVIFPFTPEGESKGKATAAVLDGKTIRYTDVLNKGESFYIAPLTGFGTTATDYDLLVSNSETRTAVRIVGDQPIVRFVYWSAARTLCPEPYTLVSVAPGKEMQWKIVYTFIAD